MWNDQGPAIAAVVKDVDQYPRTYPTHMQQVAKSTGLIRRNERGKGHAISREGEGQVDTKMARERERERERYIYIYIYI